MRRPDGSDRTASIEGGALIVLASVLVQVSSVLVVVSARSTSVLEVSALRYAAAGGLMSAFAASRRVSRSRGELRDIVLMGLLGPVVNLLYYLAITRLPLGTGATIWFLGPLSLSIAGARAARKWRAFTAPALALAGVALISGAALKGSTVGFGYAIASALAECIYIRAQNRIAHLDQPLQAAAVASAVSGMMMMPLAVSGIASVNAFAFVRIAAAGVIGIALVYLLEATAFGMIRSMAQGAIFFAFDPLVAVVVGAIALGDRLSTASYVGSVCVVGAGVLAARSRDLATGVGTNEARVSDLGGHPQP